MTRAVESRVSTHERLEAAKRMISRYDWILLTPSGAGYTP